MATFKETFTIYSLVLEGGKVTEKLLTAEQYKRFKQSKTFKKKVIACTPEKAITISFRIQPSIKIKTL